MYRFTTLMGIVCTLAVGQAQAVEWNGSKEALNSINLFEIQKTFYADLLPNSVNRGKELVRISLKARASAPDAQAKVTDTHTLTTKLLNRAGNPVAKVPDMKARITYPRIPVPGLRPASLAFQGMGIATGARRQRLLVRVLWLEALNPGGARQSELHVEVRVAGGRYPKKWAKAFKTNQRGAVSQFDTVITDTDGNKIDELVLVREKSPRNNPTIVTSSTIERYNINNGKLIQRLVTKP